jgi:hypothetical protein
VTTCLARFRPECWKRSSSPIQVSFSLHQPDQVLIQLPNSKIHFTLIEWFCTFKIYQYDKFVQEKQRFSKCVWFDYFLKGKNMNKLRRVMVRMTSRLFSGLNRVFFRSLFSPIKVSCPAKDAGCMLINHLKF